MKAIEVVNALENLDMSNLSSEDQINLYQFEKSISSWIYTYKDNEDISAEKIALLDMTFCHNPALKNHIGNLDVLVAKENPDHEYIEGQYNLLHDSLVNEIDDEMLNIDMDLTDCENTLNNFLKLKKPTIYLVKKHYYEMLDLLLRTYTGIIKYKSTDTLLKPELKAKATQEILTLANMHTHENIQFALAAAKPELSACELIILAKLGIDHPETRQILAEDSGYNWGLALGIFMLQDNGICNTETLSILKVRESCGYGDFEKAMTMVILHNINMLSKNVINLMQANRNDIFCKVILNSENILDQELLGKIIDYAHQGVRYFHMWGLLTDLHRANLYTKENLIKMLPYAKHLTVKDSDKEFRSALRKVPDDKLNQRLFDDLVKIAAINDGKTEDKIKAYLKNIREGKPKQSWSGLFKNNDANNIIPNVPRVRCALV